MMDPDNWEDELLAGRSVEAMDLLQQKPQSDFKAVSIGAVYISIGNFKAALSVFEELISKPAPNDSSYGLAGTAAWCLGDHRQAIEHWLKGVTAPYTVGAANTRTSLLLYAASILKPEVYSRNSAEKLLNKRISQSRGRNWPGPIAEFILSKKAATEIEQDWFGSEDRRIERSTGFWKFRFYECLKKSTSEEGDRAKFNDGLQHLVTDGSSAFMKRDKIFHYLRLEEFHLAKFWCDRQQKVTARQ